MLHHPRMLTRLGLLAWIVALVVTTNAVADELWVTTNDEEIWKVDSSTGNGVLVGSHGLSSLFDIAASPSGELFGIRADGRLYTIDTTTAAATLVGTLNVDEEPDGWNSMEFDDSGTLFVARQRLLTVDPTTADATVVGSTGFSASGDIAFSADGTLYMSTENESGLDDLITVDPLTGAGTLVGSIGFDNVYGLVFVDDTLLGINGGGQLIQIDTQTGAGQLITNTITTVYGATVMPVPEPSTLLLVSLASVGLLLRWVKHRPAAFSR